MGGWVGGFYLEEGVSGCSLAPWDVEFCELELLEEGDEGLKWVGGWVGR